MAIAKHGDTVSIDYVVKTSDGAVVADTSESGPQDVTLGGGEMMPKLEEALAGMEVGAAKSVTIASENAYGAHNPELVIDLPRANLPPEPAPQPGMQLQAQAENGQPMMFRIVDVGEQSVKCDANHPLAGKDISFDVTLREIKQTA